MSWHHCTKSSLYAQHKNDEHIKTATEPDNLRGQAKYLTALLASDYGKKRLPPN